MKPSYGPMDLAHQRDVDFSGLFMSTRRVEDLVKWDTQVLADVAAGTMTQRARFDSAAQFFPIVVASVHFMESAIDLGYRTVGELLAHVVDVSRCAENQLGAPLPVVQLPETPTAFPVPPETPLPNKEFLRNVVTSFIASTELSSLIAEAQLRGQAKEFQELVGKLHRFLRRTDVLAPQRMEVLSQKYANGELSLDQFAEILGVNEGEALVRLDQQKIGRMPASMRLDDQARKEKLERIAQDRARREGKPRADDKKATASAISSARLEGLDVRGCQTNR